MSDLAEAVAFTGLSVSNSEMVVLTDCRRKWFLTYYLQRGPRKVDADAGVRNLGTQIHLALEAWYKSTREDPVNPVDFVTAAYDADIEAWPNSAVELRKEKELARIMLQGYVEWLDESGADEFLKLIATEQTIEVDSPVPGVKLRGRMDQRVVRTSDHARLFLDFKTKGSVTDQAHLLPIDPQMRLYCLLEYLDALQKTGEGPPERTDGGIYSILRRVKRTATAKPPFYGRIEVRHNLETLRSTWLRCQAIIEDIVRTRAALDAGGDHRYLTYPRPSGDCAWKCPFLSICPMMDDGSRWQDMLEEHYDIVDPYARYREDETPKESEGI